MNGAPNIAVAAGVALSLSACDWVIENSRYNISDTQISNAEVADIVENDEFRIDLPTYLTGQLNTLERRIQDLKYTESANLTNDKECFPTGELHVQGYTEKVFGGALYHNPVLNAVLQTAAVGYPSYRATAAASGQHKLGFSEFENFRRIISDAGFAGNPGFELSGTTSVGIEKSFSALALAPSLQSNNSKKREPKDAPLLAYLGAYYQGDFVDRFGEKIDKPKVNSGIDDGTIATFVRILLEVAIDSFEPRQPVLTKKPDSENDKKAKAGNNGDPDSRKDKEPVFFPNNLEPTFHTVWGKAEEMADSGDEGVSQEEAKIILAGANLIAEEGLTLFGGLLEFLSSIHVGFVVAGNFAVGSNDTLKAVARSTIETALRRGAERGIYCLVNQYNLDDLGKVIPTKKPKKEKEEGKDQEN